MDSAAKTVLRAGLSRLQMERMALILIAGTAARAAQRQATPVEGLVQPGEPVALVARAVFLACQVKPAQPVAVVITTLPTTEAAVSATRLARPVPVGMVTRAESVVKTASLALTVRLEMEAQPRLLHSIRTTSE
jgi:hypothetical protein